MGRLSVCRARALLVVKMRKANVSILGCFIVISMTALMSENEERGKSLAGNSNK